jgi:hypothetical protein
VSAIAMLLWVVLRRLADVLLTLVPLLVAGVVTLELCVILGLPLNFANIIALPLLLGVGVACPRSANAALCSPSTRRQRSPPVLAYGSASRRVCHVRDLNVAKFVDRLRLENDPLMRASLQGLLLKELEKLSFNCEQLGNVQRQMTEGRRRIETQKAVIERW